MAFVPVEQLEVYQLAEKVSDEVWSVVHQWPAFAKQTVGQQLVRAADSIGANIAEGAGRGSAQDHRRFLRIARGSLLETRFWLRRACTRNLLTREEAHRIKPLFDELAPRLNSYLKSIRPVKTKHETQKTKQQDTSHGHPPN